MRTTRLTIYEPTPHRKVNILVGADFLCCALGQLGLSTETIAAQTGLSVHQVTYRLGVGHVKRADYRNGTSPIARRVMDFAKRQLEPAIEKQLIKALKEPPKETHHHDIPTEKHRSTA
jgi:hypothetical protein